MLKRHEALLCGLLLELLMICPLDQTIDSSFAQKISLHLLSRPNLTARRALIHPIDSIDALAASGCLKLLLNLLLGPLLLQLLYSLLCPLPFIQSLFLFFPYPPLIAHEHWVP